jgi:hypothetical protein
MPGRGPATTRGRGAILASGVVCATAGVCRMTPTPPHHVAIKTVVGTDGGGTASDRPRRSGPTTATTVQGAARPTAKHQGGPPRTASTPGSDPDAREDVGERL